MGGKTAVYRVMPDSKIEVHSNINVFKENVIVCIDCGKHSNELLTLSEPPELLACDSCGMDLDEVDTKRVCPECLAERIGKLSKEFRVRLTEALEVT